MSSQNAINQYILQQTVSGSPTTIDVDVPSFVNNIQIIYRLANVSGNSSDLILRLSTDGGSSFISTGYSSSWFSCTSPATQTFAGNTATSGILLSGIGEETFGTINLYGFNTATRIVAQGTNSYGAFSGSARDLGNVAGSYNTSVTANAFRLLYSGNEAFVNGGTITIYRLF